MMDLDSLQKSGFFSPLDLRFARFMAKVSSAPSQELMLAAALVSRHTREGHICFDLDSHEALGHAGIEESLVFPEPGKWGKKLRRSGVVGTPGEPVPLVLDPKNRLYLYRYWEYQEELAKAIKSRIGDESRSAQTASWREGLRQIFPAPEAVGTDWQKVAAFAAARKRFCVITGGPGTGKTTTVAKILALLVAQSGNDKLRAALVSPTKALPGSRRR